MIIKEIPDINNYIDIKYIKEFFINMIFIINK